MTESAGNSPVTRRHLLRAGAAAIPIVVLARSAGAAAAVLAAPAPAAPAFPAVESRRAGRAGELVYFC